MKIHYKAKNKLELLQIESHLYGVEIKPIDKLISHYGLEAIKNAKTQEGAWEAYDETTNQAWEVYKAIERPAYKAYKEITKPAWEAYENWTEPKPNYSKMSKEELIKELEERDGE